MKVRSEIEFCDKNDLYRWTLFSDPSAADEKYYSALKGKLLRNSCYINLPEGVDVDAMHPDVVALIYFLVYGVFTKNEFEVDRAVSVEFHNQMKKGFDIDIHPVDQNVKPRISKNRRHGLAFSGGVDSCAALKLMPKDTVAVFQNRLLPDEGVKTIYKNDAAIYSCGQVAKQGYEVRVVDTTLEYVRDPVGFPVDWSNSVGVLVLAEYFGICSVNFGMISESAYRWGDKKYSDLKSRAVYWKWAPLFEAVDVQISLPTAGLSEVVTSKIAAESLNGWGAQSCVRGLVGQPCMRCFKCFRKTILDAKLSGKAVAADHYEIIRDSREVKKKLTANPIHHENVLAYSLVENFPDGESDLYRLLLGKVTPLANYASGLSYLEKFYKPAVEYIHADMRDDVLREISKYSEDMTNDEIDFVQSWNSIGVFESDEYVAASTSFSDELAN